ncbi:hypothetical protein FRB99_002184, partial [Tulasnella sp. 403]
MSLARFGTTARFVSRRSASSRFYSTPVAPSATREATTTPNEWVAKRQAIQEHAAREDSFFPGVASVK